MAPKPTLPVCLTQELAFAEMASRTVAPPYGRAADKMCELHAASLPEGAVILLLPMRSSSPGPDVVLLQHPRTQVVGVRAILQCNLSQRSTLQCESGTSNSSEVVTNTAVTLQRKCCNQAYIWIAEAL